MNLLSVPDEVIEGSVLPYLDWNDLLRLRRVCKASRGQVQRYMKLHPELAPEIEIGRLQESGRNLRAFMEMYIPSTKIYLKNKWGPEFFENQEEEVGWFLEEYGSVVKQLRVEMVSLTCTGVEKLFLEGLKNLEELEADQVLGMRFNGNTENVHELFKQLVSLKLKFYCGPLTIMDEMVNVLVQLLEQSNKLKYLRLPFLPEFYFPGPAEGAIFNALNSAVLRRNTVEGASTRLQDINLIHVGIGTSEWYVQQVWQAFTQLCETCVANNVRLHGVSEMLLFDHQHLEAVGAPELRFEHQACLVSLTSVSCLEQAWLIDLPQLEEIDVLNRRRCNHLDNLEVRPNWPKLKCLEVDVEEAEPRKLEIMYQFLFEGVRHNALNELILSFLTRNGPAPNVAQLVHACPNLKKLTIVQWTGTNEALVELWEGWNNLEEITLVSCWNLGIHEFVGNDETNPVFLKLTKLKKLSLKSLELMDNIKDDFFEKVVRHLPLKQLILTSSDDNPITSVTRKGIEALLEGRFAETIEKFPFQGWTLCNLSPEEFQKLGKRFRSSDMM